MFCLVSSSPTWYIIKSFSITLMFANFLCVSQELYMLYFRSTHPLLQQIFRYLEYLFQVISVKKIERYKLRLFPTVQRLWSLTAIFWNRRRKMESSWISISPCIHLFILHVSLSEVKATKFGKNMFIIQQV